jgi:hypothetical protein
MILKILINVDHIHYFTILNFSNTFICIVKYCIIFSTSIKNNKIYLCHILGQKFAMLVQKIVIATLIKSYKFQSLDSEDKLVMAGEIVLNATKGIRVKIEKRT